MSLVGIEVVQQVQKVLPCLEVWGGGGGAQNVLDFVDGEYVKEH